MPRTLRTAESVWDGIDVRGPDECWPWLRSTDTNGYGQHYHDGMLWMVHRDAYETRVGPIPEGLTIDHVLARGCTLKTCCNPAHLEPVAVPANTGRRPRVVRCPQGHDYNAENTYVRPDGYRICKVCNKARAARRRSEKAQGLPPRPVGNHSPTTRRDRYV